MVKSASSRSYDRSVSLLADAVKEHTRDYEAAASLIQGIFRYKSLEDGFNSRGMAKNRLAEGVQFAQRRACGVEGTLGFKVGVIRGRSFADQALHVLLVTHVTYVTHVTPTYVTYVG